MDYEDSDVKGKSEWNEQQAFSRLFFTTSTRCRQAQSMQDVLGWKRELVTKMSHVMGILDDNGKEILYSMKCDLDMLAGAVINTPFECIRSRSRRMAQLSDLLFKTEANVDSLAHKVMPFLKLREEIDIDSW